MIWAVIKDCRAVDRLLLLEFSSIATDPDSKFWSDILVEAWVEVAVETEDDVINDDVLKAADVAESIVLSVYAVAADCAVDT